MSDPLDTLVAKVAPISDDDVLALGLLDGLERELCAAIMDEPRAAAPPAGGDRRRRRSSGTARIAGAMALAACVALALVVTGTTPLGGDRGTGRAWAAAAVRVANAVPRLLVDAPGWNVQRADQFTVGIGEMTFEKGGRRFDLSWYTGRTAAQIVKSNTEDPGLRPTGTSEVAGSRARIFRYAGTTDDFVAVWRAGRYAMTFRGSPDAGRAGSLAGFQEILGALRPASVGDWLAAMPASVVLPADQREVVRRMLADMPLPAGFDARPLTSGSAVRDRYQLGARVAGAVACAWIGRWAHARRGGDEPAAARAVAAMRTSHDWAILRDMQRDGFFPKVLWEYADAIAGSGTVIGGRVLTVQESYRPALGCDDPTETP